MGKLLRVLAIFFLVLGGVSLWLGIYLFGKREELKGRTQKLENEIITLGAFYESEAAEPEPNTYPAKDTSDCTSELLDSPTRSEFWNTYALHLEKQDNKTMDIGVRKTELMSYYKIHPITLEVERDAQGYKVTEGKDTMQDLFNEMTTNAKDQLKRLNDTRQQLKVVRQELIDTIEELNRRKSALREALNKIVQLNGTIRTLEEKVASLEQKIRDLEAEKVALQDRIAELEQNIVQLQETIKERDETIKIQKKRIEDLEATRIRTPGTESDVFTGTIQPGVKGTVVSINREWNFAVVKVSKEFIQEITTEKGVAMGVRLMVRRAADKDVFVGKIAVMGLRRDEGMAVANILLDWQQLPMKEGDEVFF